MSDTKKPFGETGFGKFLSKAGDLFPSIGGIAGSLLKGTPVGAAIDIVTGILKDKAADSVEAQALLAELEANRMEWEQEMTKLGLADRADARAREVTIVQAGKKNITQNVLAYLGVASFFCMVFYILAKGLGTMTTETSFIVGNLCGLAGAIAKDIFGYYFGSSASSAKKDATIEQMSKA